MKTVTYLDGVEFRKHVLKGIRDLATITSQTLGPGGRAILLEQENGSVLATKDGVTVAKHFAASNPIEKLVAKAAVEASERTVRSCGDGTTTSMLLAYSIVEAGHEWLANNPHHSPQAVARELKEILSNEIVPMVKSLARPIRNLDINEARQAVWHVAMVSANSDKGIADAVAEAVALVGEDGMVQCEEGAGGNDTSVKHMKGFPVTSGLSDLGGSASSAFINRKSYGDCVLSGAYMAFYDGDVNDIESMVPLLEKVAGEVDSQGNSIKRPLLIIAHGFSDQVLRFMAANFRQGKITVVPYITARNGQAHGRQGLLHDMAAYLGGQVFEPQGNPLMNAGPANIGFATEVKINMNDAVFMVEGLNDEGMEAQQNDIEKRIAELKEQMESSSEFDGDRLRYRIGQLTGGVATIYAGGATALEARERRDRVVDAVSAVRSAMDLGVIPGGGATLLHISRLLPSTGSHQILKKALTKPYIQILLNAGVASNPEEALAIGNAVGQVKDGPFYVYDALKKETVEFWESGIFDGGKTVIHALQNALSVAQLLMTTGGAIAHSVSESEEQIKAMQSSIMNAVNQGDV